MLNATVLDAFTKKYAGTYRYTTTVRHKGTVIAFAMKDENDKQQIFYTVLDLTGTSRTDSADTTNRGKDPLDVNSWQASPQLLNFPNEIAKVGYGVADQTLLPVFRNGSRVPEKPGTNLKSEEKDSFLSTTARLTADAPFQVLSDGQFVYVFRQAIAVPASYTNANDKTKARKAMVFVDPDGNVITSKDGSEAELGFTDKAGTFIKTPDASKIVPLVNSTLLVDRFVLSGTTLQPKMEVRFQRSRSKTRPQSRKDGLGAKDLDGNPFLEPTQELRFVGNLKGGRFTVLLVPTAIQEIQRWQIFAHNSKTGLIDLFDVERSPDGLFNTRGSQVYTCVDHPDVFAQKAGQCTEPSLADPSQSCNKDLVPRVVTEGYAESALRPKTSEELDAEVATALDRQGRSDLQSEGQFSIVAEPHISLGGGVRLGTVFTMEAWISPQASGVAPQALITGHGDKAGGSLEASRADHSTCPSLWIEAGSRVRVGFGSGNQWNEAVTKSLLTPRDWNHLAVTFDGIAYRFYVKGRLREKIDQVEVYINGTLQKDADGKPRLEPIAGKQLPNTPITFLGARQNSFNGTIDEIRLWSRVRSQAELQSSLSQRLVGQETRLVSYWRFDEAAGNTVYDQTDNRVNGTLQGTVQWKATPEGGTPITLDLKGWQWVASDAPVGESLGVSRSSFQFATEVATGVLELRTVESGLTALLYYQQENVISGYAAEEKPLKRNARVMLAVATKNAAGNKNEIATLDFAVSTSGKLAQVPDVVPLPVIHVPNATEQSINQQLDKASGLQGQIRSLKERLITLDQLIDVKLTPTINILDAAIATPTTTSTTITDPEFAYLNTWLTTLKNAANTLQQKKDAVQTLENNVNNATATFYKDRNLSGDSISLKVGFTDYAVLHEKGFNDVISSLSLPEPIQATVYEHLGRGGKSTIFKGVVNYVEDAWNKVISGIEIAENPDYTKEARDALETAQTAFDKAEKAVRDERKKLQDQKDIYVKERQDKNTQLTTAQTDLNALQSVLQSGVEVPMHLIHTDPFGLTISGGLLGFAWTKDTPFLFDSATGNLALYFRGTDDQFFVAYYKTLTERAQYPLLDQNGNQRIICSARSTEPELDRLEIAITSSTTADTCTVTITGTGIEETWNQMPRNPELFARVLNGLAGEREYVGSGSIVTELGQVKRLTIPAGIGRSLSIGDILFVGKTKVIVQQAIAAGAIECAIASDEIPTLKDNLPLFFVEYDYAANAQTTKVPNDLYNGSLLIRAAVKGALNATSKIQIGQRITSGSTLSCKWTAAAPGSTLTFDGKDDVVALANANATTLKPFEAPRDVTLEAWVKPSTPFRQRAQSKTVQIIQQVSNNSSYSLGLHQLLSPALILDGQDDYVRVPLNEPETNVTHELWFKTSSPNCGLFSVVSGPVNGQADRHIYLSGGNIMARITNNESIGSTNLNLADDTWHHVAHVFGTIGEEKGQRLYVDGKEVAKGSKFTSDFTVQDAIVIGYSNDAQNPYFKGQIDEVRIWDRVRTPAEIQSSMSDRLTGSEANLIGYWYFDEVTGTTVKDYSASNKPGTLYGNPQIGGFYWFAGVNDQFVRSRQTFPTNTWSHLAATFRQSYGLEFDGLGGYLDCGNDSTLDISRDLTIEVFLKVADLARGNGILSRGRFDDGTEEQDVPYALFIGADGRIGFSFENIKHETKTYYSSGRISTQFCKIAVTRKREQPPDAKRDTSGTVIGTRVTAWDTITFYINGVASGSSRYESTQSTSDDFRQPVDVGSSNQSLEIGRGFNSSTVAFRGTISEVRIWNTAREQGNIAQEIKGNEKGLVSWWQFEENDGNIAYDSKSRNHATIKGTVKWVKDPNPLGSKLLLYYNGALVTTDSVSAAPLKSSEPQFTLAACRRSNGIQAYFQGELEEVRIWKICRTQEQIQDNLFRRLLGEQDDLIAYYTFDLDSDQTRNALTTLYDRSSKGNNLTISGATYILSTAPLSDDAPIVRSALAGVKTAFHGLIQSQPGVQEYGDMQYDIDGNLIGVFKRCYSFIKDDQWQLLTSFKVGDLITEWIGQMQTDPQLIGYIEGAPPVPSENLTATGYVVGEFADYTGASSVELAQADSTTYTYSASKDAGFDMSVELKIGGVFKGQASAGFVFETEVMDTQNVIAFHTQFENSLTWLEDASTGVGRTTTQSSKMELRGYVENADAVAYPKIGRRFVPENMGMALVKSDTADIFALRLKHNQALVSFQMRPNPDIPPDRNIITFPLNPRYVKQGTLDGKIGVLDVDPDYPNAFTYSPDSSYFKPIEAYAIKNQIEREEANLQTYYEQYDAGAKGRRQDGLYGQANDLTVGRILEKLPKLQKRNLVNNYVWTAAGGLYAETQETMDVYREQLGGAYAFKGMAGLYTDLTFAIASAGMKFELDAMFGGHLNLTVTKSQESQRSFGLNVGLDKVESDVYLRNEKGEMVMDKSGTPDPNDPTGMRHWKPQSMPGRVDAYRFMSFYLEPRADHFDLFFNRVVDPIWLEQSDHPSAVALREARQKKNNCWRIMHRVTYVSRVLPPLSNPAPSSLEKALQTLDIDSNYELIRQLEPFVSTSLTSYPEFTKAIREAIKLYLPELQPHTQEIIRYMSLYYGIVDTQDLAGAEDGVDAPRTINQPPIVNAGVDQTIGLDGANVTVTLDGTAIDDRIQKPEALFVTWEKVFGEGSVEFANPYSLNTTATFTQRGKYGLRLTVDDGSLSASDEITIVVNQRPVISAGDDLQVRPRLDGGQPSPTLATQLTGRVIDSGLGDPDRGIVTVKWTQQSRLGRVTFSNDKSLETTATFDKSGNYLLKLTVDNGTFTADDEVMVSVAARTTDQLEALYTFDTTTGTSVPDVSGAEDPLNLTISDPSALTRRGGVLSIQTPCLLSTVGSVARLTQAMKASNELTIEVWLKPDVLNHEGLGRIVTLSDGPGRRNFTLGQSGDRYYVAIRTTTTDPNASRKALTAGSISTTELTHLVCTRSAAGLVRLYLNGQVVGSREVSGALSGWDEGFRLALGNESGTNLSRDRAWTGSLHLVAIYSRALSLEDVQQNYKFGPDTNLPPVISAGPDQEINWSDSLPILSQLNGRATHDRAPQPQTITWTQVAGPGTPNGVTLTDAHALSTTATFTQSGRYGMRLTVDDGELMASDEVVITVNLPPTFTAQADPNLALIGGSVVTPLKGSIQNTGLGNAGTPTTTWRQISGPSSLQIAAPNQLETTATFRDRGVYTLELEVNNGKLPAQKQPITINVHQTPSVRAGEPQIVTLPIPAELPPDAAVQSQVTLTGIVQDSGLANPTQPDGLLFKWEQVSGPVQAVFADDSQHSTTATFTVGGIYILRFTATNRQIPSLTSSATVEITVNQRPVVNAGANQTIQLPAEVELDATVSDDGLPTTPGSLTLRWEKVTGPGIITFTDATSSYTTARFSKSGTYVLRLTAKDGAKNGAAEVESSDTVEVIALAPPRVTRELLALYTFEENGGTIVNDTSGIEPRLNLTVRGGATLAGGILTINSPAVITSTGAATKLIQQAKVKPANNHAITIEIWLKPKNISTRIEPGVLEAYPARILTLSGDNANCNFTLGQQDGTYIVRLRTSANNDEARNGINNQLNARDTVKTNAVSHLVYTWSAASQIARFYQDGNEVDQKRNVSGNFSSWNDNYPLVIANEAGGHPRAWMGEVHLVAIYNTALTPEEVNQNFLAGSGAR